MTQPSDTQSGGAEFPLAQPRPASAWAGRLKEQTRMWWLTAACAIVAVVLVASVFGRSDPQITVTFASGHGIKPGDALRYRGIDIGRVTAVVLNPSLDRVEVQVELEPRSAALAREGSQFWIERPRVSLARVSGLETVVGARYLGVIPGNADAPRQTTFTGLQTPPTLSELAPLEITIRFADGHGLSAGDALKHRGIVVGEVADVVLDSELAGVDVKVHLVESVRRLARAGSQFWIERPQLSLTEVRGLETVVGGRFLAVQPGPADAEPLTVFDGLPRAPPLTERAEGGLEIILEGLQRSGLQAGSVATYRGIVVGRISSVGLSVDVAGVEARVFIQPEFRQLIRANTRFWAASGLQLSMGLTGLRMDVESLSTLAAGGVALATPEAPGEPVATGHRFTLHFKPEDEWLQWRPRIALGSTLLPEGLTPPRPLRASLHWRERRLGLARGRQLDAWVLPLDDGSLLGAAAVIGIPTGATDGKAILAVAGKESSLTEDAVRRVGKFGLFKLSGADAGFQQTWPRARLRVPDGPEECLLVSDPQLPHVPLAAARLSVDGDEWVVDPSLSLDQSWDGASVVSRRDGAVIGLLHVERGQARVLPLVKDLLDD